MLETKAASSLRGSLSRGRRYTPPVLGGRASWAPSGLAAWPAPAAGGGAGRPHNATASPARAHPRRPHRPAPGRAGGRLPDLEALEFVGPAPLAPVHFLQRDPSGLGGVPVLPVQLAPFRIRDADGLEGPGGDTDGLPPHHAETAATHPRGLIGHQDVQPFLPGPLPPPEPPEGRGEGPVLPLPAPAPG